MLDYAISFLASTIELLCVVAFCVSALSLYQCVAYKITKKFKYARFHLITYELMLELGVVTFVLLLILIVLKLCGVC